MPHITRAYHPSRYGQLHYRIAGPAEAVTAPPLLCLHQTPGNGHEWEVLMAELAKTRVVIAADTPGYGMSDAPPAPAGIPDFASVMATLMADLAAAGTIAPGGFDVMGMHTGSIIAAQLALCAPAQVRRVVMFSLAAYPADVRAAKLAALRTQFPVPDGTLAHVEKLWAIFGQLGDKRMTAEYRHTAMAECLRLGSRMPWGYIAVYQYDFEAALAQVSQPVLVVNPQDDLWEPTHRAFALLPNARRWDLPGRAHGFLSFESAQVAAEITSFLA